MYFDDKIFFFLNIFYYVIFSNSYFKVEISMKAGEMGRRKQKRLG